MADELDDLFGAIDGSNDDDEGGDASLQPAEKDDGIASLETTGSVEGSKNVLTHVMSTIPSTSTTVTDATIPTSSSSEEKKAEDTVADNNVDQVKEIATGTSHDKSVRSYSAYPKALPEGHKLPTVVPPSKPAKEYPFPLDPFQSQAVAYIDKEESVLVAAHTSAGKTAVAEYAIAKSLQNGQRVVYTSPIKVRSNT